MSKKWYFDVDTNYLALAICWALVISEKIGGHKNSNWNKIYYACKKCKYHIIFEFTYLLGQSVRHAMPRKLLHFFNTLRFRFCYYLFQWFQSSSQYSVVSISVMATLSIH